MYEGICELAAENGASREGGGQAGREVGREAGREAGRGCFRRPLYHNMGNVNVLKEDKMISRAFSVFSFLGALLEQQLHNGLVPVPLGQ